MIRFYRTKDISLRRSTYFEPSNVEIGQGVWALQVSKNKVGKPTEAKPRKNWVGNFTLSWRKMGWSDHNQILHTCGSQLRNNLSDFSCWYSKFHRFCRGWKLGFPLYFVYGPYNCSTNVLPWSDHIGAEPSPSWISWGSGWHKCKENELNE